MVRASSDGPDSQRRLTPPPLILYFIFCISRFESFLSCILPDLKGVFYRIHKKKGVLLHNLFDNNTNQHLGSQ